MQAWFKNTKCLADVDMRDQGSFRDPAGYVAHYDGRIFRVLREDAFAVV